MVGYTNFTTPLGNVVPTITGGKFVGTFSNSATFKDGCADGEYRQYVKGEFKANGSVVQHRLCGDVFLSKNNLQEDGCPPGKAPGVRAYGYRSRAGDAYDRYSPTQAAGCSYNMYDAPGFNSLKKGTTYKIDLSFRGALIDTSDNNKPLVMKDWTVIGEVTIALAEEGKMMAENLQPVPIAEDDHILAAIQTVNEDTKQQELHIVIGRTPGKAPLDPASIHVEATGMDDGTISTEPPVVYEVGDWRSATATAVFALPSSVEVKTVRVSSKADAVLLTVERD
ncbi:hypothetical protein [Peteryoungia ipomoeae]|uniref:Uncharacterized protein n=1 Tax=Peteryoungia ipomoeae TaxID=1210932 RepID=A0A4S8NV08_9HYPH|nr:hypothetical protein [Peteryoungia ipomoeae]THV21450.1 hypothetical protein FAA97_15670 [Peteryoungia ipomoeae]